MTFKYSDFYESATMRNLAKIAVDEGIITSSEVENSVAKLAGIKSLQPTNDLFNDIAKFAAAMRSRGYTEEADNIEQKMFLFKMAENQYYDVSGEEGEDLIEFAHQDGEAEVAPSSEGRGVVETEVTGQKKRLDVVNKKPTGKYASEITDMLLLASNVLGLEKKSQYEEETEEFVPKVQNPVQINHKLESLYDDINQMVPSVLKAFHFGSNVFKLTEKRVWENKYVRNYYQSVSGIGNGISKLFKEYQIAYGKVNGGTEKDLINNIMSKDYNGLKKWAHDANIWPGYFVGSRPYFDKAEEKKRAAELNEVAKDQGSSIWVVGGNEIVVKVPATGILAGAGNDIITFSKNKSLVQAAAVQINNSFINTWTELIKHLDDVNEKIQEELSEYKKAALSAIGNWKEAPKIAIDLTGKSTAPEVSDIIHKQYTELEEMPNMLFVKKYERLIHNLTGSKNIDIKDGLKEPINTIGEKVAEISTLLAPVAQTGPVRQAKENFDEATELLRNHLKTLDENSQEYLATQERIKASRRYSYAIQKGIEAGRFDITEAFFGQRMTREELLNGSEQWLDGVKKLLGKRATNKNNVIKIAQFDPAAIGVNGPSKPAPTGTTAKPVATIVGQAEKDAVTPMQERLNKLGSALNSKNYNEHLPGLNMNALITKLLSTGRVKGPGAAQDGVWGQRTFSALEAAKQIIRSWNTQTQNQNVNGNIFSGVGNVGYIGKSNTVQKAQENTDTLNELLSALTGKGPGNKDSYGTFMLGGKSVNVGYMDIASLSNLLDFIVSEGIYGSIKGRNVLSTAPAEREARASAYIRTAQTHQETLPSGVIDPWQRNNPDEWARFQPGLTFEEWKKVLFSLATSAKNQITNPETNSKSRVLAERMLNQLNQLWEELKYRKRQQQASGNNDVPIDVGETYRGRRGRGRARSPRYSGYGPEGYSEEYDADFPSPNDLGSTIDARKPWWGGLNYFGILDRSMFRQSSNRPEVLAAQLGFKTTTDLEKFIINFINKMREVYKDIINDENLPARAFKPTQMNYSYWVRILMGVLDNIKYERAQERKR